MSVKWLNIADYYVESRLEISKKQSWKEVHTYVVEMSSSWNFSARASPSYEGSKPSQAKLVQFNFQAETKLK